MTQDLKHLPSVLSAGLCSNMAAMSSNKKSQKQYQLNIVRTRIHFNLPSVAPVSSLQSLAAAKAFSLVSSSDCNENRF